MGVIPMLDIPSVVPSGSSAMVLEEEDPLLMPWEHFEAIAAMKHCTSCRKNKKLEFFGGMATCDECRPRKARKRAEGRKAKRVLLKVGGQEGAASQQKRAEEERATLVATVEEQRAQIVLLQEATGRKPKPCLCGQEAAGMVWLAVTPAIRNTTQDVSGRPWRHCDKLRPLCVPSAFRRWTSTYDSKRN